MALSFEFLRYCGPLFPAIILIIVIIKVWGGGGVDDVSGGRKGREVRYSGMDLGDRTDRD